MLGGIEYYFGQGIQTAVPGSTHHGQPIEVVHLGTTELPKDVVEEYIQSLEEVYSPEVGISCYRLLEGEADETVIRPLPTQLQ